MEKNQKTNRHSSEDQSAEKLQEQIAHCEKERNEYLAGWKRERADFTNYKKEEAGRREETRSYVKEMLLEDLLPILDSLDRAETEISEHDKNNKAVKGLLQTLAQLRLFLKQQGIEEISADGVFDPDVHEAVMQEDREGAVSGTVIELVQRGYRLNGKVLRPARVKVAK